MRIQETDRVLKEAKYARHNAQPAPRSPMWTWITGTVVALLAVVGVFTYLRRNN